MKVGLRFCGQPSPLETPINTGGMARLVKDECTDSFLLGIITQIKRQDKINILSSATRFLIFMSQGYQPYGRKVNNIGEL